MIDEEDVTAQLLRLAGAPPHPSPERIARVREIVHREWLVERRRRMARRAAAMALLGVAALVLIAVWISRPRPVAAPIDQVLAVANRIQGRPLIVRHDQRAGDPQPLSASTLIHPDDVIATDDASRTSMQATDGSSVRIDRQSRVRFLAPSVLEVIEGAVYIATTGGSQGFEVRTPMGVLHDLGTQFEVRVTASSLRVRVRAGAVEIRRGSSTANAPAGTEAMVTASGIAVRQVPAHGAEWEWAAEIAPSFAIEGRPLRVFLEHITAEEGWTLHYADPAVADAATRTILHGSVDGLKAEDALGVALGASGLRYRLRGGELLVSGQ